MQKSYFKTNIIWLFMGQLTSVMGSAIFNFALSLFILDTTKTATDFSMVLVISAIPKALVTIFGGALVDVFDRKKLLIISDSLSVVSILAFMLPITTSVEPIVPVIICVSCLSISSAFFTLTLNASIPQLVETSRVLRTNTVMQGLMAASNIIGPAVGAILYDAGGIIIVFLVNAISFVVSCVCSFFLTYMPSENATLTLKTYKLSKYFLDVKDGIKYIFTNKVISFLLGFTLFIQVVGYPIMSYILPFVARIHIQVSSLELSIMEAAWGVGMAIGAIIVATKKSPNGLIKKMPGFLVIISCLVAFIVVPRFTNFNGITLYSAVYFASIASVIIFLLVLISLPMMSFFQTHIPEDLLGRVFGVLNTIILIGPSIGTWLYGLVLDRIDWGVLMLLITASFFAFTFYASRHKAFNAFITKLPKKEPKQASPAPSNQTTSSESAESAESVESAESAESIKSTVE